MGFWCQFHNPFLITSVNFWVVGVGASSIDMALPLLVRPFLALNPPRKNARSGWCSCAIPRPQKNPSPHTIHRLPTNQPSPSSRSLVRSRWGATVAGPLAKQPLQQDKLLLQHHHHRAASHHSNLLPTHQMLSFPLSLNQPDPTKRLR